MKLEINHKVKKKAIKNINTWNLNKMVLNTEWVNQEIKGEMKKMHGDK